MSDAESNTVPNCAKCGETEYLVADPNMEGIWICRACLERDLRHQAVIDHGFDDEEPRVE
jgi:ribosomal protein L37AE/L43A